MNDSVLCYPHEMRENLKEISVYKGQRVHTFLAVSSSFLIGEVYSPCGHAASHYRNMKAHTLRTEQNRKSSEYPSS